MSVSVCGRVEMEKVGLVNEEEDGQGRLGKEVTFETHEKDDLDITRQGFGQKEKYCHWWWEDVCASPTGNG